MAEEKVDGLEGLDDFGDDFGEQLDSFMENDGEEESDSDTSKESKKAESAFLSPWYRTGSLLIHPIQGLVVPGQVCILCTYEQLLSCRGTEPKWC